MRCRRKRDDDDYYALLFLAWLSYLAFSFYANEITGRWPFIGIYYIF